MEDLCKACHKRLINHKRSKCKCTECLDSCKASVRKSYKKNKDKVLAYQKEYATKNKESILEYKKTYLEKNKEIIAKKRKTYKDKNKELILKQAKEYREKNKEKIAIAKKKCVENNPELYKKLSRKWKENNREHRMELSYISTKKRRAIKYGLTEHYTNDEWKKVLEYWNFRCVNCGTIEKIEPDHIVPLSKGGSDKIDNIQPLCLPCNRKKATKTIDYRWDCT